MIGIVDWFSRKLMTYNVVNTMDAFHCVETLRMAIMERFWWALKYEELKIKEYVSLPQLRFGVQHYVNFYNAQRVHEALRYKTPDKVYFGACNSRKKVYIRTKRFTQII